MFLNSRTAIICCLLAISSLSNARTTLNMTGAGFEAPQIDDRSSVSNPIEGEIIFETSTGKFVGYVGSSTWTEFSAPSLAPTVQKFTSGSGTYTTPTNPSPLYIKVKMVGGGGGGGGSHNGTPGSVGTGGNGGNTTFGTTLLVANGGGGGAKDPSGTQAGGTASLGTGPIGLAIQGGYSSVSGVASSTTFGGQGTASPFGGSGSGGANTAGTNAIANSGSGGGGAGNPGNASSVYGGGGAAGGYVEAMISSPSSTYSYAVGAGGTSGSAGTSGYAGGVGGSGQIIVEEYYQ